MTTRWHKESSARWGETTGEPLINPGFRLARTRAPPVVLLSGKPDIFELGNQAEYATLIL
jgi:hypothetical protein